MILLGCAVRPQENCARRCLLKAVTGWALKVSVNGVLHSTTPECIRLLAKALSFHHRQVTLCQRNFNEYRWHFQVHSKREFSIKNYFRKISFYLISKTFRQSGMNQLSTWVRLAITSTVNRPGRCYWPLTSIRCRFQWPRCLRRRSAAARLLRSWVRIPSGAWMCCLLWLLCVVR